VSSGDLVQQFEAVWTREQLASHRAASEALYRIKDRAFDVAFAAVRHQRQLDEFDLQQQMWTWFAEEGLDSDSPPVVAVGPHASSPHYLPTKASAVPITADVLLLLDLWGKRKAPHAVFADITWVGYTGRQVPERMREVFAATAGARDAAVTLVQERARAGQDVRGFEADRAARQVLVDAGFGAYVAHRTGHNLGESVHGNGAHLDDYETHDERRLLPGTGFTVEPGLYLGDFGVRSEINVYRDFRDAVVTGARQEAIVSLV
jgi:Xaa-Pro dipeptidase